MSRTYSRVIHWFRRDLRLTDNTALLAAHSSAVEIIPTFILSDWETEHLWTGAKRQHFLSECLESLAKNLDHLGGSLIIRQGQAVAELLKLAKESGAEAIYLNQDVDPFGQEIENELKEKSPIPILLHQDAALHGVEEVLKGDGSPYRVYTPFSKRWLPLPKAKPAGAIKEIKTPRDLSSLPLPTVKTWKLDLGDSEIIRGGEKAARARMSDALKKRISSYDDTRDIPSIPGTSRLSQDLRWGTLSIRELYHKAQKCGSEQYLKELAWREFYFQILHHFPEVLELEFNADWRGLPWDEPGPQLEAWKTGQTDNRVRMIVAMFLTKDLHLDWRLGEQFFAQHLLDGEIASNNGGWQWSAGTGADAAPYFRIQNPWSQTKRFDPQGVYIKRWVPELADTEAKLFHLPPDDGQPIAAGYPSPILDHSEERKRTLEIFKKHRAKKS